MAGRKPEPTAVKKLEIDGYSGFLCFDKDGKPMVVMHREKYFQHAVDKYNSIYRVQLPKIIPHVCRHTYCSNMAKSGMNPKVLPIRLKQGLDTNGLNLKSEPILDHILDHLKEETCRDKPK